MTTESRYGIIPLGNICPECTLESPNIIREVVCTSFQQLWEVFWCQKCSAKGFVNVSVHYGQLQIFEFNPDCAVADLWSQEWTDWDFP